MSYENPNTSLFDTNGIELSVSQSQALNGQPGFLVFGSGSDGTAKYLKLSSNGDLFVTGAINTTLSVGNASNNPIWVTGTVTNSGPQGNNSDPIWVTGSVYSTQESNSVATGTIINSAVSPVTLLAANNNRRCAIIFNDSTKRLYVKLGTGVAAGNYTIKMSAQGYWEIPGNYTGIVQGVWDSVNGFAAVTEILD